MGSNRKTGGRQKGPQNHGEGQHGDKTRRQIASAWNHPGSDVTAGGAAPGGAAASAADAGNDPGPGNHPEMTQAHAPPSKSHLFSDRSQSDDADLNSEKTRQVRDAERHGHIGRDEWSRKSAQASAKRKS
jgi:hypothetical protein